MLTITLKGQELFDEKTQRFSYTDDLVLHMEHSLVSLSKWESVHQKAFLGSEKKTEQETLDYAIMMITDPVFPDDVIDRLSNENLEEISRYMDSSQSATTFREDPTPRRGRSEIITSELIYYWMTTYRIPFETQYWNLNRLFALLRICALKSSKPRKVNGQEARQSRHAENMRRRAALGTSG